ncbi:hypothetical protein F8388_005593 [Cannabis sativa]|uniref:Uncharacterized protein n=1 Tax=Cannabis sativa TaxID=3483 RepID=A0A7J6FNC3_CANSA|nr:hypothetical protein G4B88_009274 [Cannabis sativa]KAF4387976.1 hypothetical protein F8388_005593 [Cannabis sativa]
MRWENLPTSLLPSPEERSRSWRFEGTTNLTELTSRSARGPLALTESASVVVHATPNGPNAVGSTFMVALRNIQRDALKAYEKLEKEKKFSEDNVKDLSSDLQIHNLLNLNQNLVSINILFDVNMGTSKGMKIENNMDLEAYLIENNTKEDLRNCPLIVEVIEKNQTMALSRTTSIAATTSASNATRRKKTAASSSAYSDTNSTSSRASGMATKGGQEVQSPLTVLPSMGIEDLRVNHMFKNKEDLKYALSRIVIKKNFQYKIHNHHHQYRLMPFPSIKFAGGHLVISIKANCIDSTIPAEAVFQQEVKKLQAEQFKPFEQVTIEPFEHDHACVVGGYRVENVHKNSLK